MDSVDDGAAEIGGYSGGGGHTFQEFLEERLSREAFMAWLLQYPYSPGQDPYPEVEEEINRATLALRNLADGDRTRPQVRGELMDARGRLSGLAYTERRTS